MEWTGELMRLSLDGDLDGALTRLHRGIASGPMVSASASSAGSHGGVDESSLLAEAEELLEALGPGAFATRTPSLADDRRHSWTRPGSPVAPSDTENLLRSGSPPPKKRTKTAPRSESPTTSDDASSTETTTITVADKKVASWRDKVREEVMLLRKVSTKLEVQLLQLEQQSRSTAAVRNKRVQVWKRLAERQHRLRELALADNQQLRAMMDEALHFASSQQPPHGNSAMIEALMKMNLPNYIRGSWKEPVVPTRDAEMASVFEPLLRRLDVSYGEMDAVFRENGMRDAPAEPNSYLEKKTRRLGKSCRYLELGDLRILPFPWRSVGHFSWVSAKEWHCKDKPYMYPCGGRREDTFAVNYRVTRKAFGENAVANFKIVARLYVESDRHVTVYTCQSDGERELAGVSMLTVGWVVVSEARLSPDDSIPPVARIQSCMHVFQDNAGHASDEVVDRLVDLMMCAFEEDVGFINQNVDNRLLEEARARTARIAAVDMSASVGTGTTSYGSALVQPRRVLINSSTEAR